jgi:hypothetical protein
VLGYTKRESCQGGAEVNAFIVLFCFVLFCFVSFVSFNFFFYENVEMISDPLGIQLGFFFLFFHEHKLSRNWISESSLLCFK